MSEYLRETPPGFVLIARALARPGMRDELLALLEEAARMTAEHEAEGPLMASFNVSAQDPDLVVLVEHWPGRAAFAEHQAVRERVPASGELLKRMNAVLAQPMEMVETARTFVRFTRVATQEE